MSDSNIDLLLHVSAPRVDRLATAGERDRESGEKFSRQLSRYAPPTSPIPRQASSAKPASTDGNDTGCGSDDRSLSPCTADELPRDESASTGGGPSAAKADIQSADATSGANVQNAAAEDDVEATKAPAEKDQDDESGDNRIDPVEVVAAAIQSVSVKDTIAAADTDEGVADTLDAAAESNPLRSGVDAPELAAEPTTVAPPTAVDTERIVLISETSLSAGGQPDLAPAEPEESETADGPPVRGANNRKTQRVLAAAGMSTKGGQEQVAAADETTDTTAPPAAVDVALNAARPIASRTSPKQSVHAPEASSEVANEPSPEETEDGSQQRRSNGSANATRATGQARAPQAAGVGLVANDAQPAARNATPDSDQTSTDSVTEITRNSPAPQNEAGSAGAPRRSFGIASLGASNGLERTEGPRVDPARFVSRVTRAFHYAQERGGTLQLRLSPPELGSLRLMLNVKDGVLNANLEAETPAARRLLLEHLPALRDRLAEQNVRIERFDVDLRRDDQGHQRDAFQQGQQHSSREQADQRTPTARPVRKPVPVQSSAAIVERTTPAATTNSGINLVI